MAETAATDSLKARIRELEHALDYYRAIAEHATDMISRHDPEGVFSSVSPSCRDLLVRIAST